MKKINAPKNTFTKIIHLCTFVKREKTNSTPVFCIVNSFISVVFGIQSSARFNPHRIYGLTFLNLYALHIHFSSIFIFFPNFYYAFKFYAQYMYTASLGKYRFIESSQCNRISFCALALFLPLTININIFLFRNSHLLETNKILLYLRCHIGIFSRYFSHSQK